MIENSTNGRLMFFLHFRIVKTFHIDLTNPKKKKKCQDATTEEDEEERMIMEFNNNYTFSSI